MLETLKVQKKLDNPKTPVYTFEVGKGGSRMHCCRRHPHWDIIPHADVSCQKVLIRPALKKKLHITILDGAVRIQP